MHRVQNIAVRHLDAAGTRVAYAHREGDAPTVVFLPGYASTAFGTKGDALDRHCTKRGQAYLRLDYPGHGASDGDIATGTLGGWLDAALAVIDALAGPRYLVCGSSLGGWLMLHVALRRPTRVAGLIGVAAAVDFTRRLQADALDESARAALERDGVAHLPSRYGNPLPIGRAFLEEAEQHLLLNALISITSPIHLLHGVQDPDVPWQTALKLASCLTSGTVNVELIEDGDHRLARPGDLARVMAALDRMLMGLA